MAENVGSIFSTVGVSLQSFIKDAKTAGISAKQLGVSIGASGLTFQQLAIQAKAAGIPLSKLYVTSQLTAQGFKITGATVRDAGQSLKTFGNTLATTLGIALRWYVAYRVLRSVFGGISEAFVNMKKVQIEEVFARTAFAGEDMGEMLKNVSMVAQRWGFDIAQAYSLTVKFGRALGVDLKTALYLASEAMITARASGENLDEAGRSIIGMSFQLNGNIKSTIDFLDKLYASAYFSDVAFQVLRERAFGASDGMDNITDATERALTPLKKFGLTNTQIAAIMGVMITRLDQSGQSIGGYTAKLLSALVGNENIRRAFREVGVDLLNASNKWEAFTAGMAKMNQAQKEFIDRQLRIGIGVEVAMNFTDMLNQVNERAIKIQENLNQRRDKATELTETLTVKQDRLKVATQILGLAFKDDLLPPLTMVVEFLTYLIRKTTLAVQTLSTIFIKAPVAGLRQLYELLRPPAEGEGFVESLKNRYQAIMKIGEDFQKDWTELSKEYISEAEWDTMIETGVLPERILSKLKEGISEIPEVQKEVIATQTELNDKIKEFDQLIRISDYSLGIFATEQEKNTAKAELLRQKIDFLNTFIGKMESEATERTLSLELAEARFQLESIETHYGNIVELAEKLIKTTYEGKPTLEDLVKKTRQLSQQFEDISVRGLRGLIDKTKTWRDILADIGDVVLEEIIRKLVRISIGSEVGGGGLLGSIAGIVSLLGMFGGGGGAKTYVGGKTLTLHQGGEVIPRYQFGGEVLAKVKPGEFIVNESATRRNKDLLEAINQGRDIGGKTEHYYMFFPHDMRTFAEYLMQNEGVVRALTRDAQRRYRIGYRSGG